MVKESFADVKTGPSLNETDRAEFLDLVQEYSSLFTEAPGTTNLVQHHTILTSNEPVRSKLYPVLYSMRESNSPYASLVVVVKKKDGSNRVCVDYRKLNKLTVFDPEPMPAAVEWRQVLFKDQS